MEKYANNAMRCYLYRKERRKKSVNKNVFFSSGHIARHTNITPNETIKKQKKDKTVRLVNKCSLFIFICNIDAH